MPRLVVALGVEPVKRQEIGAFVRCGHSRLDGLRRTSVQLPAPLKGQSLVGGVAHQTVSESPTDGSWGDVGAQSVPHGAVDDDSILEQLMQKAGTEMGAEYGSRPQNLPVRWREQVDLCR